MDVPVVGAIGSLLSTTPIGQLIKTVASAIAQPNEPQRVGADKLSLSQAAQSLQASDLAALRGSAADIAKTRLGSMQQARLAAFQQELGSVFQAHDIDTSTEIELRIDGQGRLRVANEHPDAEKINQLLDELPDLTQAFRQLAGLSRALRSAETTGPESGPFAAYAEQSAFAQNDRFTIGIQGEDIRGFYTTK